jgi:NADH-quinone oxidoreductase subunit N
MGMNHSLQLVAPELVLSFSCLALLLIAAWRGEGGRLVSGLALAALLVAAVMSIDLWWIANGAAAPTMSAFDGLYSADSFAQFSKLLIYFAAAISLLIAPRALEKMGAMRAEYPVLILLAVIGMGVMVSATDLLTLYVGLELNSLAAYVLASLGRNDGRSAEAGLKYFVLGALASGILLFGMSLLYGFTGATSFESIGNAMAGELTMGLLFGLIFVLSGLAFKISAAPFHMWTPDVYEGAPTPVTAFFASAPKVAATALLMRVTIESFGNQLVAWQQILIVISLMSIIVGAVGAIGQQNLKRLLAYSSINNIGFLLIGLAAGTVQGVSASLIYLVIYVVMTLGGFICLMQLRGSNGETKEMLSDIAGLSKTKPSLAAALAVFMFSLAGIPPLFGFWGKLVVFNAAIAAGLFPLAIIGIAASVIGAFYYLKVIKTMYFDEPNGHITDADDMALGWIAGGLAIAVSPLGYLAIAALTLVSTQAAKALF